MTWENLKKNKNRETNTQKKNKEDFTAQFGNLFDVAHEHVLKIIDIQEDCAFLLAQWKLGRRGCRVGQEA